MQSKILFNEMVQNKERKFGSELTYYPCKVIDNEGIEHNALFTADQIGIAIRRAETNPEDIPQEKNLWQRIFG